MSSVCFLQTCDNTVCYVTRTTRDSDICLNSSPDWERQGYTCSTAKGYCESWSKDLWRCCPETCRNGLILDKASCYALKENGNCIYPFFIEKDKCTLNIGDKIDSLFKDIDSFNINLMHVTLT